MSHRSTSPETSDPAFKLFGTHIPSHELETHVMMSATTSAESMTCSVEDSETPSSEGPETVCPTERNSDDVDRNPDASTGAVLKKPDKIVPCPRCNSMETKFCYFNNYNVNQPRHFCRSCQRYWTAGGSVRNLPVGAGRRKSKHASSKLQSLIKSASEGYTSLFSLGNYGNQQSTTLRDNRQISINNTGTPLCMAVTNKLTLEENEKHTEAPNVTYGERTGDPSSSCSSLRESEVSHKVAEQQQGGSSAGLYTSGNSLQGFPVPLPYPYMWSFGMNGMPHGNGTGNAFLHPGNPPTMPMINSFCLPNMVYPFVPSFGWNWDPSSDKVPCGLSLSPGSSGGDSPSSLGKHSRDVTSKDEEKTEKNLWMPKTLRIDDPEEAAKSSIWSTLGISPGKSRPISKGGIFKAFQPRTGGYVETSEAEKTLEANPAALSRSQRFHENT